MGRKHAGQDAPLQLGAVRDKQRWKRRDRVGNVGVVPRFYDHMLMYQGSSIKAASLRSLSF